ncbi:MAG TPA: hypothetical protein VF442_03205, partial [Sphingobium sp.]
ASVDRSLQHRALSDPGGVIDYLQSAGLWDSQGFAEGIDASAGSVKRAATTVPEEEKPALGVEWSWARK